MGSRGRAGSFGARVFCASVAFTTATAIASVAVTAFAFAPFAVACVVAVCWGAGRAVLGGGSVVHRRRTRFACGWCRGGCQRLRHRCSNGCSGNGCCSGLRRVGIVGARLAFAAEFASRFAACITPSFAVIGASRAWFAFGCGAIAWGAVLAFGARLALFRAFGSLCAFWALTSGGALARFAIPSFAALRAVVALIAATPTSVAVASTTPASVVALGGRFFGFFRFGRSCGGRFGLPQTQQVFQPVDKAAANCCCRRCRFACCWGRFHGFNGRFFFHNRQGRIGQKAFDDGLLFIGWFAGFARDLRRVFDGFSQGVAGFVAL